MNIEKAIKTDKFRNEYHKLAVNIIYTSYQINDHHLKIFKKYGITQQQFNILRILRGQYPKPATISLLKERMLDKMSDTSRLVERLKVKALVERNECPEDRRLVDVLITKKGINLLKELDEESLKMDKFMKNITPAEAKQINDLLDKLRGDVKKF